MNRSSKVIDYLDLRISIPSEIEEDLQLALDTFLEEHLHIEVSPKIKKSQLLANSTDLIAFMGYIPQELAPEFAFRRFLKECTSALEQQLIKSIKSEHQAHYKWCQAALKSLPVGRHLDDEQDKISG
jgi:hypothetical protein